jgi:hypothetical protein
MADLCEMVFGAIAEVLIEAISQEGIELARGLQTAIDGKSSEQIITLGLSAKHFGSS